MGFVLTFEGGGACKFGCCFVGADMRCGLLVLFIVDGVVCVDIELIDCCFEGAGLSGGLWILFISDGVV